MTVLRLAAVVVLASLIASITDWVFMRMLFHDRYMLHPEVWRGSLDEGAKIFHSELIGILACLGFALLVGMLRLRTMGALLVCAFLVWLAAAVPILAQDGIWMKIDPLVLGSMSVGWLIRLLITAILCALLLRPASAAVREP